MHTRLLPSLSFCRKKRTIDLPAACAAGQDAVVSSELALGANANEIETGSRWSLLHIACLHGKPKVVLALLQGGADPLRASKTGTTPIFWAAWSGCSDSLGHLLAAGASPNFLSSERQTPLFFAAQAGHRQCAQQLLDAGANPLATDSQGLSPADAARNAGYDELADLLSGEAGALLCRSELMASTQTANARRKNAL